MNEIERQKEMEILARMVQKKLWGIYGKEMGFFLNVSPMGAGMSVADYISNCDRSCAIEWMEETVKRFRSNQVIEGKIVTEH